MGTDTRESWAGGTDAGRQPYVDAAVAAERKHWVDKIQERIDYYEARAANPKFCRSTSTLNQDKANVLRRLLK